MILITDPQTSQQRATHRRHAFTLIELLVVISIIALLISILLPSLSRARDQGKGVVCLARLHEFGTAFASYENISNDQLPPALWSPGECDTHNRPIRYGWEELIFQFVYKEDVDPFLDDGHNVDFPVQRNLDAERWAKYFLCKASSYNSENAGHYRVYLPSWADGTYGLNTDGTYDESNGADPEFSVPRTALSPKAMLLGDSNERSHRGDGDSSNLHEGDDGSFIDAGEANEAGPTGQDGNRFSDRHYGGTNYLFQDFHAEWSTSLRKKLARDWDQNGVDDIDYAP
ncbi:MAG: prepilin-type N-terminal cleavage/methylation domain-containing protein [Phycisphaerales bacterium]|nr:prepilin-type N-terminal cleavage/methylation domain-containing protein [Phycisphaerales bacterium]